MILFFAGAGAGALATLAALVVVDLVQHDQARRLAARAEPTVRRHPANRPACRVIPPVFDQEAVKHASRLHGQIPH